MASSPVSRTAADGLELRDVWITAAVRCAPPANKPTVSERDNCASWLDEEVALFPEARIFLALGSFGYVALWRHLMRTGADLPRPRPAFGHGAAVSLASGRTVLMSYHPSQQNTFTGRLTEAMFDDVFATANAILERRESG